MPNDLVKNPTLAVESIMCIPCRKRLWSRHHWGVLEGRAGELETPREVCASLMAGNEPTSAILPTSETFP